MPQGRKTGALLLCSAMLLSGCAVPEPRLLVTRQMERPSLPPTLLICQDSPDPPDALMQREVADFILQLWEAGEDCRTKLAAVRGLLED